MSAKKNTGRGRPEGRRDTVPLQARVDPALAQALDAYVESRRPRSNTTAAIVLALEELLTKEGFWPPTQAEGK